jgi:hypothetical protein
VPVLIDGKLKSTPEEQHRLTMQTMLTGALIAVAVWVFIWHIHEGDYVCFAVTAIMFLVGYWFR